MNITWDYIGLLLASAVGFTVAAAATSWVMAGITIRDLRKTWERKAD
jgi:hypothetical protein